MTFFVHSVRYHKLRKQHITFIPKQIKHFILWTYNHIKNSLIQCTIVQHKLPQHLKFFHTPKKFSCVHIHKSFLVVNHYLSNNIVVSNLVIIIIFIKKTIWFCNGNVMTSIAPIMFSMPHQFLKSITIASYHPHPTLWFFLKQHIWSPHHCFLKCKSCNEFPNGKKFTTNQYIYTICKLINCAKNFEFNMNHLFYFCVMLWNQMHHMVANVQKNLHHLKLLNNSIIFIFFQQKLTKSHSQPRFHLMLKLFTIF